MNLEKDKDRAVFIAGDIKHILTNGVDEVEAKILRTAIQEIKKKRSDEFDKSLDEASRIVASWPKWKRDLVPTYFR